jgi:hypothetical protein
LFVCSPFETVRCTKRPQRRCAASQHLCTSACVVCQAFRARVDALAFYAIESAVAVKGETA